MDMLRAVSKFFFIANVSPNELVIQLKTVGFVEGKKATSEHGQTRRGPDAVNWFPLLVGSTCSRNTLATMITENCFKDTYFHQSLCDLTVSNIAVDIQTKNYGIPFVTKISQELAQILNE